MLTKTLHIDKGQICKKLKRSLDKRRYTHTIGVSYTAAALAMCYDTDIEKAEIAGLLHDCAKCMDDKETLELCDKHRISITDVERRNPFLLHAKLCAFFAMQNYGIKDKEIISAIINHTTGHPEMTLLEKIVFVADYIEPNRKKAPNLSSIRHLAFINLDQALLHILEDTLGYLKSIDSEIDEMTQKTYEYYQEKLNGFHDTNVNN
ncbi:MAG: HD domain-containing protein [Clostridia bacterium]|nr:HD domain-containing protein [Clostridia bacterium]